MLALAPFLISAVASLPATPQSAQETGAEPVSGAAATDAARAGDPWWESFPQPVGDLVLGAGEDAHSSSMMELVETYADLTGQSFLIRPETRQLLENAGTGLHAPISVPAAEVQPFFEALLINQDFILLVLRERAPRLLSIRSLRTQDRNTIRAHAHFLPREKVELMRDHPALIMTTTVNMPYTDVRQLSNAMRSMITDSNTQQVLPAGNTNTMILTGIGGSLADLVEILEQIDAEARAAFEKRAAESAAPQQAQGGGGASDPPPSGSEAPAPTKAPVDTQGNAKGESGRER